MRDYREYPLEPRVRALCDFAVQMTKAPASPTGADVERVRSAGWSDSGIHDAIQVVSYFNYIIRIADAVGTEDEPEWT